MARRVTVSTIGAPPLGGGHGLPPAACGERMMAHWRTQLAQVWPERPDLVVLPEMCDRFADHDRDECLVWYAWRGDRMREFFAAEARAHRCYIAYSGARQLPDGTWRNATQLLDRQGAIAGTYDKNHPIIEETTEWGYLPGADPAPIACDFGTVACAICFDLNFDELRLKIKALQPDLILFSSAYHGGLMQPYWAYSCRAHFVSAVFGTHPSQILSPQGVTLAHTTNYFPHVTARLNLDCLVVHLDYNWDKLAAARAKYGPEVSVVDPGYLGSVLLTSESEARTAREIAGEFGIELLDDYLARAVAHRHHYGAGGA
jgi:predicted amidohydrolase